MEAIFHKREVAVCRWLSVDGHTRYHVRKHLDEFLAILNTLLRKRFIWVVTAMCRRLISTVRRPLHNVSGCAVLRHKLWIREGAPAVVLWATPGNHCLEGSCIGSGSKCICCWCGYKISLSVLVIGFLLVVTWYSTLWEWKNLFLSKYPCNHLLTLDPHLVGWSVVKECPLVAPAVETPS